MSDDERRQRYAEAMYAADAARHPNDPYPFEVEQWDVEARAVMAVADAERAELRAEIDRLRRERDDCAEALKVEVGYSRKHCTRAEAAERALAAERAKVARVEALLCDYETAQPKRPTWQTVANNIRAALAGPEAEATA